MMDIEIISLFSDFYEKFCENKFCEIEEKRKILT